MRKLSYRNKVRLKQTAKSVGVLLLVLLLLGGLLGLAGWALLPEVVAIHAQQAANIGKNTILLADLALHYLEEGPCHALRCQGKLSLLFAALLEAVPHRPVSGEEALEMYTMKLLMGIDQ